jgi:hypothetical protein
MILINIGKRIDDDTFCVNGVVLHHFIDGNFNIFKTEYEYRCWGYDDYPETEIEPLTLDSLYELFKYLEGCTNE